jgi:hypothetical protein
MEEQLITFETAKLAKEKGLCDYFENSSNNTQYIPSFYSEDGINFEETEFQLKDCIINDRYYRPTQSLLQKWLRKVHSIIVQVVFSNVTSWDGNKLVHYIQIGVKRKESNYYDYIDRGYNKSIGSYDINSTPYPSWEEALERGLQEALLMIK